MTIWLKLSVLSLAPKKIKHTKHGLLKYEQTVAPCLEVMKMTPKFYLNFEHF